jgi:hypothetical protein
MARFLLSLGAVCLTAALVHAQDDGPEPTKLHPAPLPSPALKYQLLPDLRTQTAGDAIPLYNEAQTKLVPLLRDAWMRPGGIPFQKWSNIALQDLPREDVRKALEPYQEILDLVDKAARREHCQGEAPPGTSKSTNAGLPESYYLSEIGNLVAVRARLQIADGDLSGALHTLQTGFSLARQTGELPRSGYGPTGTEIAQAMVRQIDDFIEQPKAPNLYWALTVLPQPLFDPRPSVVGERLNLYHRFPGIAAAAADLNAGPLTEEQVQACVEVLMRYFREPGPLEFRRRALLSKRLTEQYDENKKVLLDEGRSKDKVEAMPHVQVALLAKFHGYERVMDDQMKYFNEPYYKVSERVNQLSKVVEQQGPREKLLFPVVPYDALAFLRSRAQLERKINCQRCLEAIRAYAAGHDGKLPTSLAEIKDVLLPLDPVTGKAFDYKLTADKATLESPEVSRESRRYFDEMTYEIVIKR